jgi:predicted transcriptional regulator
MSRSKLEMYTDILRVLAQKGPLQLNHIVGHAGINSNALKGSLDFLIKQGLVEEKVAGKNSVFYANTERGAKVIKFFKEINNPAPIKEAGKFLPVPY